MKNKKEKRIRKNWEDEWYYESNEDPSTEMSETEWLRLLDDVETIVELEYFRKE